MTGKSDLNISEVPKVMEERKEEWLALVGDLISIPSENPPGDTTDIAGYFSDYLDEKGIPYEVIDPKTEMPNIVAQFDGEQGNPEAGPHLAFNGHLDTFPRREEDLWETDPFSGEVSDDKIHGRGASDMHGGFTASVAAFLYLFEHRDKFAGRVTLAAVSDEETGGKWGSKYIVEEYPEYRGDVLISGEPSSNRIIRFGERGRTWLDISVRGRSAHTCSVPQGLSAIDVLLGLLRDIKAFEEDEKLVNVPPELRELIRAGREEMDDAYGDGATERILGIDVNIGTVDGGEKVNLVAETANAEVDIRLPIGTTTADVLERVRDLAEQEPGEIQIENFSHKDPSYSDPDHPIFNYLQESADEIRGGSPPALSCALAGTDCAFYRREEIPCAVYGPSPHNLGSQNEYIYVEDFMEVVKTQAWAAAKYIDNPNPAQ